MPNSGSFLLHTLIIWGAYVATFYFGTKALGATADLSLGVILVTFVVGSLAVSFTNGGLGAFPLMIAEVLLLYGIAETAGTTFGWILWTSQTIILVIAGGISFLLLPILNKIHKHQPLFINSSYVSVIFVNLPFIYNFI